LSLKRFNGIAEACNEILAALSWLPSMLFCHLFKKQKQSSAIPPKRKNEVTTLKKRRGRRLAACNPKVAIYITNDHIVRKNIAIYY